MIEQVILVNQQDQPVGQIEKMQAHQRGLLHRAFSVFVFRKNASNQYELLLQQRQLDKYHSGGLWTNSCCGHPRPDEDIIAAGERRLQEEMGIRIKLRDMAIFHYKVELNNELIENEIDHVLVGDYQNEAIEINSSEVADYRWMELAALRQDLNDNCDKYTAWFAQAFALTGHSK